MAADFSLPFKGIVALALIIGACNGRGGQKITVGGGTEYVNGTGGPQRLALPDGNHVVLQPGTKLVTAKGFGVSNREVDLDGEAIFEVEKGQGAPFTVHTRNLHISVITALASWFHVDAFRKNVGEQLELLEGRLQVNKSYHSDTDNSTEVLEVGDMVMINRDIDLMEKEKMSPKELEKVKAMR
ncbi:MAG: FecR domain-containing protein [Bacteroidetes bacterium]|nr:FecR domain-containing protein [Bacteroidota bacterium]